MRPMRASVSIRSWAAKLAVLIARTRPIEARSSHSNARTRRLSANHPNRVQVSHTFRGVPPATGTTYPADVPSFWP